MKKAKKKAARRPQTGLRAAHAAESEPELEPVSAIEDDDMADVEEAAPPADPRLAQLERLASGFKAWRPAREVLTKVRAVQTIFPQYDRATRVGGHPIERFTLLHGPSGHGKTTFVHGLGLSFLQRHHFYGFIDAEYTTPDDWLQQLMALNASNPMFLAMRPQTYEEVVDGVREFLRGVHKAAEAGDIAAGTSALVAVDSFRKLVPENIWKKINRSGAEGKDGSVDGMGGRAAQIKAALNAAWLDEITPMLAQTGTAMVAIARESEDVNADANDKKYGRDYKITGGKAVYFDASLVVRVTRASWVREGAADDARVVGERHRLTISKSKVAGKDDRNIVCHFHTSNGNLVPAGFDRPRDVLELAIGYGIVEQAGGWLKWGAGSARWQGASQAVRRLHERPDAMAELEASVRARFAPDEVLEVASEEEWP